MKREASSARRTTDEGEEVDVVRILVHSGMSCERPSHYALQMFGLPEKVGGREDGRLENRRGRGNDSLVPHPALGPR